MFCYNQNMNEKEWLTTTDARQMHDYIGKRLASRSLHLTDAAWDTVGIIPGVRGMPTCEIMRDVIGNPFRPIRPMDIRPSWLTWRDGTVKKIAESIIDIKTCSRCCGTRLEDPQNAQWYADFPCKECDGRGLAKWKADINDMAILADALEEAGCNESAILDHLRGTEKCPCKMGMRTSKIAIQTSPPTPCREMDEVYCVIDFRVVCSICRGTGFRPVAHFRECWVLQLILGTSWRK